VIARIFFIASIKLTFTANGLVPTLIILDYTARQGLLAGAAQNRIIEQTMRSHHVDIKL
jgi:hypothetical protein